MSSTTIICNKALHYIGIGDEIASINERSPEAEACLLFYSDVVDEVLREWPWPFARRRVTLAAVNTTGSDGEYEEYNSEFFYAYRYPSDCLFVRRIVSGTVPDNESSLIRYQIASDTAGRLILTNEAEAEIDYTCRISDVSLYPVDFANAISWRLASFIAMRLSEDPVKAGQVAMRGYALSLEKARAVAAMEESEGPPPKSSFQRAR